MCVGRERRAAVSPGCDGGCDIDSFMQGFDLDEVWATDQYVRIF